MKKTLIISIIILIIIATMGINFINTNIELNGMINDYISYYKDKFMENDEVLIFSINDYDYYINEFSTTKILKSDRSVGDINNAKEAKEQAEIIWKEIFGEEAKKEKPYKVYFDENSKVWYVKGTLPPNYVGGVLNIIMTKKDGKILAIWGEK